jgi:hypothetical protein
LGKLCTAEQKEAKMRSSMLPLATDIAATVERSVREGKPLDIEAAARGLAGAHPGAQVAAEEVAEALRDELAAASARPPLVYRPHPERYGPAGGTTLLLALLAKIAALGFAGWVLLG